MIEKDSALQKKQQPISIKFTKIIENWGKIGIFQVFLVHLCGDVGFWVNNGGWCVNLWSMGNIDKKNTQKNAGK